MDSLFNNTPLIDCIFNKLARFKHAPAIILNNLSISHLQLLNKSLEVASHLKQSGIKPGMHVGIFMPRSPDALVSIFSLWYLEAVYVPLETDLPNNQILRICHAANLDFILTTRTLERHVSRLPIKKIFLHTLNFSETYCTSSNVFKYVQKKNNLLASPLACILYGSESMAKPKGLAITHQGIINRLTTTIPLLKLDQQSTFLSLTKLNSIVCFLELLSPFLLGGKLIFLDKNRYQPAHVICQIIQQHKVNVVVAAPSLWSSLIKYNWNPTQRNIIAIVSNEEVLLHSIVLEMFKNNKLMWDLYAITEIGVWVIAKKFPDSVKQGDIQKGDNIGQCMPGHSVFLIHKSQKKHTELFITGENLPQAYDNKDNPAYKKYYHLNEIKKNYKTDDCYAWQNNADLVFYGKKRYLNNNIKQQNDLEEIEKILQIHPEIKQAVVCFMALSKNNIMTLLAYLVINKIDIKVKITVERINDFLRQYLPYHLLPKRYFIISQNSLNKTTLTSRQAVLPKYHLFSEINSTNLPDTPLQQEVTQLFCLTLKLKTIALFDNFYDQGGSLLLLENLLRKINNYFVQNISLEEMLALPPSIYTVARLLEQKGISSNYLQQNFPAK